MEAVDEPQLEAGGLDRHHVPGDRPTTSDSASPTLPAATVRIPEASSIAAVASVTVVFPLVPVTATYGTARWEAANSSSLTNGRPVARVSTIGPADSGMPGLVTTRSTASRRRRSQSPPWVVDAGGEDVGPGGPRSRVAVVQHHVMAEADGQPGRRPSAHRPTEHEQPHGRIPTSVTMRKSA